MTIVVGLPPLGLTFVSLGAVCALVFIVLGNRIVNTLPPMQKLHLMRDQWGNLYIRPSNRFQEPVGYRKIGKLCRLRFEEVADSINTETTVPLAILDKRFGDIVSVVHYSPRYVDKVVKEINAYAAGFLILFFIGVLAAYIGLRIAKEAVSIVNIDHELFANPLMPIPVVQAILLGLSGLRLWMEMKRISFLLEVA